MLCLNIYPTEIDVFTYLTEFYESYLNTIDIFFKTAGIRVHGEDLGPEMG
jgi:hypothetical protein